MLYGWLRQIQNEKIERSATDLSFGPFRIDAVQAFSELSP